MATNNIMSNGVIYNASDIGGKPWTVENGAGANLVEGAQMGMGPRIMSLDGSTPNVLNACYFVMINMPQMWVRTGQTNIVELWRTIFEIGSKTIDGIDFGYQLETGQTLIGSDGQNADMPTVSKRTPISPSVQLPDVYGNIVWNATAKWIRDIQHPDTQVSQLSGDNYDEADIPGWVYSTFTATACVIQPDPTGIPDRIQDAYFVCNMFPTETGNAGFKRAVTTAEIPDRTIPFKAVVAHTDVTKELGRVIAKSLNAHRINWQNATTAFRPDIGSGTYAGMDKEVYEALRDYKYITG